MILYFAQNKKDVTLNVMIKASATRAAQQVLYEYCSANNLSAKHYTLVYERIIDFKVNQVQGAYSLLKYNHIIYQLDSDQIINTLEDFQLIE